MSKEDGPLLLLILDGWGIRNERKGNSIKRAKTPTWDKILKIYPHTELNASGNAVGLPKGFIGNSEVGHLTIGAGRIISSDLQRINAAIKDKSFFSNKALCSAIRNAKRKRQKLHLMGLLSDAGVHSHIKHLFALLKMAKKEGIEEVYVHAFLDGRDTPPKSAAKYLKQLELFMRKEKIGELATIMGRFYAMDRDNRWKREHKAYDCMVNCKGRTYKSWKEALKDAYKRGETDEFVKPSILINKCVVDADDSVIFFNFRSDRARELTRAFVAGDFQEFSRKEIGGLHFVSLTQYEHSLRIPVAFEPQIPKNTLGELIATQGRKQLRVAETEKWAHVTYFFNGLCECIFENEKRIHIPSRKVNTYDTVPAMKVKQIVSTILKEQKNYDFIVANIANADMVGHSGNVKATIESIEAVDTQLSKLLKQFKGMICITADHGNAECMIKGHETAHSLSKVPFVLISDENIALRKRAGLADVAPTVLELLRIKKPEVMTGKSMIKTRD